ncbi:hypothetical protein KSP40_PGU018769 [Platanthera guangdongensis]|uniref:Pentatricopeptide repeat-containing protein n=1 Tax=Platanthera guangdongensis TaxID=2320717 RepID=A0ABR2LJK9_9ASPA
MRRVEPLNYKISTLIPARRTLISRSSYPKNVDAQAIKTGFDVEIFHGNQLIDALLRKGELRSARKVFDGMPHKNTFTSNRMLSGYANSGRLEEARELFHRTVDRNVVAWTIMIGAYSQSGCSREAFGLFHEMSSLGITPDRVAVVALLSSCQSPDMRESTAQVHAHVVKFGFDDSVQVSKHFARFLLQIRADRLRDEDV